ncbi:hypothetical protein P4O66_004057 [Electrophorus voltai]|uniref:Peptidase A2 domain-containing protein n=1 Tax=Electrophorus voltai TaxID=2609070 RepID=A0AAD8ZQD6_9TELE|nr:hypothetical protein P4O66_004057 [Electrophorus voltai]
MNLADPMLSITVENHELQFLVDTGTRQSALKGPAFPEKLGKDYINVVGFSGKPQCLPMTLPLRVEVGGQVLSHPFVCAPSAPMNLLGRDLLIKSSATVLCSPEGLSVNCPNGTTIQCFNGGDLTGQYLMTPVIEDWADIYWGLLKPETTAHGGLLSEYLAWKPWITLLEPYVPTPNPLHVTLFYDREHDDVYQEEFYAQCAGEIWEVSSNVIYVAPEGVAAAINLTPKQLKWYMMQEEAAPHVSLALHPAHQAKELGPMVKKALSCTDWVPTQLPDVK